MAVLLALAPLLLFLATLVAGHYVGEERIARLAARLRRPKARCPRVALLGRPQSAPVVLPRGGRLIAASLAHRGPPAVLVVT
jgi:hypothetical protein